MRELLPQLRRCVAALAPAAALDAAARHWSRSAPPLSLATACAFFRAVSEPSSAAWDTVAATELWTAPGDDGALTRGAVVGTVFAAGDPAMAAAAAVAYLSTTAAATAAATATAATAEGASSSSWDGNRTVLDQLRCGDFTALEMLLEEVRWRPPRYPHHCCT